MQKKMTSRNKNGQIKMAETVSILIVFFLILFIGLIFYSNYEYNKLKELAHKYSVYNSIEAVEFVTFLPELKCTFYETSETGCIDLLKLKAMNSTTDQFFLKYYDFFGNSLIKLKILYPEEKEFVIYNHTIPGKSQFYTPVAVTAYDPIEKKYSFAILEIYYNPPYS